jgi:hypothetical protein
MKRRYKTGDWFRVPLAGEHDAIGIITHACRSRLFGYFFPVAAAHEPSFDELKRFRASDAVTRALFGGAGLEEARWTLVATSLPFDPAAWPFPQFASRGVFGRTWSRISYDPETMSIAQREVLTQAQATELPDARFATPEELESLLQMRISGEAPDVPLVVCEVRAPIDLTRVEQLLSRGGRLQFSEPLEPPEVQRIAAFIDAHLEVELRVHGFARFDVRDLREFTTLRSLVLDAGTLEHMEAIEALQQLESLRIGTLAAPVSLAALQTLPGLHRLEVRGAHADMQSVARLQHLDALSLYDTQPMDWRKFGSAPHLRSLLVAHARDRLNELPAMPMLERLALRDLQLTGLPDLSRYPRLHAIELRNVTMLRDLSPLLSALALRELRIEGMPQLEVADFRPLQQCAALKSVSVDLASKTKSREVHRLLRPKVAATASAPAVRG